MNTIAMVKGAFAAAVVFALLNCANAQTIYGIGTNPQGTLGYSTGVAIAKVLSEKSEIRAHPQPVGGSSTYLPMVNRQQLDFGFANVAEVLWAYKGEEEFIGQVNENLRLVTVTYPLSLAMAVIHDSPFKTIADLKGARGPAQFTSETIARKTQGAVLATAGLSIKDLRPTPVRNFVEAMKLVGTKRLDTAITPPATAIAQEVHSQLSGNGGIRHLPIETSPEALERMRSVLPGSYVAVLEPSRTMPGVREKLPALTYSNFLVAGAHVPDEVIYSVIQVLHANKNALVAAFGVMRGFEPNRMNESHPVPYHPGAVRFFKEKGQWPPISR